MHQDAAVNRPISESVEADRTSMHPQAVRRAFIDHLRCSLGKDERSATLHDRFVALALVARDRLMDRWIQTQRTYQEQNVKMVYYLSAEFLLGRALANNLINLGLYEIAEQTMREMGVELGDILEQEVDPGLGNGGLGRLAACYLDSMATLSLPGFGYGIRYEFGIFDQEIRHGAQVERPEEWLRFGNPWEIPRPEYMQTVRFGGRTEQYIDPQGRLRVRWEDGQSVLGIPYDMPISGYRNGTVNTLRLWSARASREFDLAVFNAGDYERAVFDKNASESISKVLYPNDLLIVGKELRLKQQYFFVACAIADLLCRYRQANPDQSLSALPDKVAIQLNDTHPSIAIPELMRLLVDEHLLPWEEAWRITQGVFAYTNHTLLPEALERWSVELLGRLLPRHLQIIYEINRRFLRDVWTAAPGEPERLERMSLVEEYPQKAIRMAHLATVGSHAVNGVAALHSRLIRERLLPDFARMYPERFLNITNGVTPRRWLLQANPLLAQAITARIGQGWITDLGQLEQLTPLADDPDFQAQIRRIKQENKLRLCHYIYKEHGLWFDPEMLFDVQVKRLHEYKRQLLNVLHIITLYLRLKDDPNCDELPRLFVFGAKAAPGYVRAKLIIRLINAVADVINKDPAMKGRLGVVFLANYRVSLAERIMPAADLSEQISLAGMEASGTGNMKLAMNGALTIGTLDGANIEIRDAVGPENFFLFGLTADEVAALRPTYNPHEVYRRSPLLRRALDLVRSGFFSLDEPDRFHPLYEALLPPQEAPGHGDEYLVLADFDAYAACQREVAQAYRDPIGWTRKAILNIARMGPFSSDRSVREYAERIWNVRPVPPSPSDVGRIQC
ncbi:MAG: glycogen/starch/alpha-glucan phosphorylase [Myxococcales bacterium]|nr:glycogen/starch/alpha-glucan phosphorylase [Myxococcales bacterium]